MPLWLIPLALTAGWLIAVFCFGGYGKNIFNPLAIALVFLLAGYASSVSMVATKPFPGAFDAFRVWTAGINPPGSVITESLKKSLHADWSFLAGGLQPSLPGLAFPGVLLLMALFTGLIFGGRRIWLIAFVMSVVFFTLILQKLFPGQVAGCFNILLIGITPALILACLADSPTIPDCAGSQVCHAVLFALLLVCFVGFSELLLHAAFALLLVQILCPLLIDALHLEKQK
jgi:Na+-translocating ferredoxin:NAD+ oxidoreductase RnfD subunit